MSQDFTAYHVVTERPMALGQIIHLDETWESGVYRRVMEKLPMVEQIYNAPKNCLYVSESLKEAKQWAEFFIGLGRPTYQIVKLQISGRRFVGNANLCFDATSDRAYNREMAQRYWQIFPVPTGEPPIWEILVDGEIQVEKIVEEIGKNL